MSEKDLCGQRYGKLIVLKRTEKPQKCKTNGDYWLCRCDCGNETVVLGSNLRRGHTTSCGCKKLRDLTGQHIGKLTVLGCSGKYASRGKRRVREKTVKNLRFLKSPLDTVKEKSYNVNEHLLNRRSRGEIYCAR